MHRNEVTLRMIEVTFALSIACFTCVLERLPDIREVPQFEDFSCARDLECVVIGGRGGGLYVISFNIEILFDDEPRSLCLPSADEDWWIPSMQSRTRTVLCLTDSLQLQCGVLREEDGFYEGLIFRDPEFHISGKVNKHNVRIWGSENSRARIEHERDSPKLNVFSAIKKKKSPAVRLSILLSLWLKPRRGRDPTRRSDGCQCSSSLQVDHGSHSFLNIGASQTTPSNESPMVYGNPLAKAATGSPAPPLSAESATRHPPHSAWSEDLGEEARPAAQQQECL
ncbi:hypothetical protein J6590_071785 [Homalodisca vitripennis]|nr:hypothetical protein J6590_071785 [Homalodisca vitripennis]